MSVPQQVAITATGIIWSYYATQITPVNLNLLTGVLPACGRSAAWRRARAAAPRLFLPASAPRVAVNVFMGGTGIWHISRIVQHKWAAAGGKEAPVR